MQIHLQALFKGVVTKQARFIQWQTGTTQAKQRVILGQAWITTIGEQYPTGQGRQTDNPGTRAVVQESCKQSPNGKAKGKSRKHGQESKH